MIFTTRNVYNKITILEKVYLVDFYSLVSTYLSCASFSHHEDGGIGTF